MQCNSQITKKDIFAIIREVVRSYPYVKCKQPNMFAILRDKAFFNDSNFQISDSQVISSEAWSRTYENQGQMKGGFKKEYPLLAVESVTSKPSISKGTSCHEFYLVCVDRYDCPDCECARTYNDVSCDTQEMLFNILREIRTFSKYQITQDGETYIGWLSRGQAECLVSEGATIKECCTDPFYKVFDNIKVSAWGKGMADNITGWAVRFEVCGCIETDEIEFDYKKTAVKQLGTTVCTTCK